MNIKHPPTESEAPSAQPRPSRSHQSASGEGGAAFKQAGFAGSWTSGWYQALRAGDAWYHGEEVSGKHYRRCSRFVVWL